MKNLAALTALLVFSGVGSAHAQACVPGTHHWDFLSTYHTQTRQKVCDPNWITAEQQAMCENAFNSAFPWTGLASAYPVNAIVGFVGVESFQPEGQLSHFRGFVPAACVLPAGGSPLLDGVIMFLHSPRYNPNNPTSIDPSFTTLRGSTTMCVGGSNDTVTMAQTLFRCGSTFDIHPINYNGWLFSVQGQEGHDTIVGGTGGDLPQGGNGDDNLRGAGGGDMLYGDGGRDTLNGEAGNDWTVGGLENDKHGDTTGALDRHAGSDGSDCFFDPDSANIDGQAGLDICTPTARAGADALVSCELREGWCIVQ
jgi:hypothetical protein